MELPCFLLSVLQVCLLFSFCRCQGHYENVALNKPCNMSSQKHAQPDCSGAVNGNTNGVYTANGNNCIHTDGDYNSSWWEVNLGRRYPVCNITIWTRLGEEDRMAGVRVLVDEVLYHTFTPAPSFRSLTIYCSGVPPTGTFIRLAKNATQQVDSRDHTINVCEVQVLSCSRDFWGSQCDKRCGNCSDGEVCDKVTGHCDNCSPGWKLPLCSECDDGYWGSDCSKTCGNCATGEVCDKVTGHCDSCSSGWKLPLCDTECDGGYWGSDCSKTCGNCATGEVCDKVTGHCDSCSSGWKLRLCSVCEDGFWGTYCEERCGNCSDSQVCDKLTGHCTQCSPGFVLPLCNPESQVGGEQTKVGYIVGAAVGALAVLVLMVALVILLVRRHKSRKQGSSEEETGGARDTTGTSAAMDRADRQHSSRETETQQADQANQADQAIQVDDNRVSTEGPYIELVDSPSVYDALGRNRNSHLYSGLRDS